MFRRRPGICSTGKSGGVDGCERFGRWRSGVTFEAMLVMLIAMLFAVDFLWGGSALDAEAIGHPADQSFAE
jgi:hypothetical protein